MKFLQNIQDLHPQGTSQTIPCIIESKETGICILVAGYEPYMQIFVELYQGRFQVVVFGEQTFLRGSEPITTIVTDDYSSFCQKIKQKEEEEKVSLDSM